MYINRSKFKEVMEMKRDNYKCTIEEFLNSIFLCLDEKLNIIIKLNGLYGINQIVPTQKSLQDIFLKTFITILEEYKITYDYIEVKKFTEIFLKSDIKFDYRKETIPAVLLILIHIEQNVKEMLWNYINLFSDKGKKTIINEYGSILSHQLDFNLEKIAEISIYNLRIFLLAHFSKILGREIVITTPNDEIAIINEIDMKNMDNGYNIFSTKSIKLVER